MKKHLFIISALLLGIGISAAAQTQEKRDLLDKIEDLEIGPGKVLRHDDKDFKVIDFSLIDNFGYGLTKVDAQSFSSKFGRSWEFFINIVNLSINPTKWLSLSAGGDIKIDNFKPAKDEWFTLDNDNYPLVGKIIQPEKYDLKHSKSRLLVCSLSVPVTLGFNFGECNIRGGAEFFWPLQGKRSFVETKMLTDEGWIENHQWKVRSEKFSWDYMAAISWDGLGLYFKYYPKPLIPASVSSTFNYWTAGIVIGF